MTANLPYGPSVNTDIDYYRSFFGLFGCLGGTKPEFMPFSDTRCVFFRRKQMSLHLFIALLENTFSSLVEVKHNVLT